MDFELSEEQRLFRDAVAGIAERHLRDKALERAQADRFPREVAALLAEHGLMGLTIAEADGGQGGTLMDAVIAIEQVARVCPRSADVVQSGNFGPIRTFAEYGSAEQKARYLADLLAGAKLIALGMTEPDAGSAVTDLSTSATPDGDGYRLNGSKIFSTHSPEADLFLIYCRYGPGVGGIGSVLIERGSDGFTIGPPSRFMNGEAWSELHFDNVLVPADDVLLPAGGFKKQISGFNAERCGNAARALALGRHAYELAREHAHTRHQFGRPLCEFQGLQWKFAEMAVKLEAAQLLLYRAAANAKDGLPDPAETAIAKLACNTAGFEVANEAMQVMGGHGFSEESLVQYCVRRTRGWMIAGGSVEMMKNRIAEAIFERRFPQRPER